VVADVAVEVRRDELFVFVPEMHHALLDAGRLVVEHHRHDRDQIPVFEPLVLELAQQVPGGLPDDLAATRIAVFVGKGVDSTEQILRHRNANDSHILTHCPSNNRSYY